MCERTESRRSEKMDQWFMAAAACGDSIIWITDPGGHFMKLDIKTNRVEYIQPLRDMAMQLYRSSVLCVKDRVAYFVANMGKYLIRLFIDGNYFETIQIDCEKMQLDMYAGVLFDGEDLIILPIYSDEYVCINLGTKRVVRKKMGLEVGKTQIRVGPRQFLAKNDQRFQNKMYLLTSGSRRLVTVYKDIREMCETTLPDCIGEAVDLRNTRDIFIF